MLQCMRNWLSSSGTFGHCYKLLLRPVLVNASVVELFRTKTDITMPWLFIRISCYLLLNIYEEAAGIELLDNQKLACEGDILTLIFEPLINYPLKKICQYCSLSSNSLVYNKYSTYKPIFGYSSTWAFQSVLDG